MIEHLLPPGHVCNLRNTSMMCLLLSCTFFRWENWCRVVKEFPQNHTGTRGLEPGESDTRVWLLITVEVTCNFWNMRMAVPRTCSPFFFTPHSPPPTPFTLWEAFVLPFLPLMESVPSPQCWELPSSLCPPPILSPPPALYPTFLGTPFLSYMTCALDPTVQVIFKCHYCQDSQIL